jgi:protocatechuate 3,4-dioxygenase beta subunit
MGVLAKGTRVVLFDRLSKNLNWHQTTDQKAKGTVQGTVTDPAGAAVADATVTLTDTSHEHNANSSYE